MDKKKVAIPLVCHGHSRPVMDLFYSPVTQDGFFLINADKGHKGAVWGCGLDSHALRTATASADFTAKLWDALTGDVLHSFEHKHIVRACAFSEDTHLLLTGGVEKILRIYDLNRSDAPPREVNDSLGSVRTASWLHSDQTILSSCTDFGGVRLWDVRSSKIVRTLETKSSVTRTEVNQDGRYIPLPMAPPLSSGTLISMHHIYSLCLVKSYDMPCNVESASFEPKVGNMFIAGGDDMWVHIFDFHTRTEMGCNKGHHGPVHCVRFGPGGESYASGSEDGTIRIWHTAPFLVHNNEKETVAANGDSVKEVSQRIEGFHIAKEDKADQQQQQMLLD